MSLITALSILNIFLSLTLLIFIILIIIGLKNKQTGNPVQKIEVPTSGAPITEISVPAGAPTTTNLTPATSNTSILKKIQGIPTGTVKLILVIIIIIIFAWWLVKINNP